MKKLLSIIVPSYNMEQYLYTNLNSLIIGEEFLDKLEVIVVNDGSVDGTASIGASFEKKYPETFRLIDKENGNYGSCVNAGLKQATGLFIKIMDADDSFETQELEKFISELVSSENNQESIDLFIMNWHTVNSERNRIASYCHNKPNGTIIDLEKEECLDKHYNLDLVHHAIAYRTNKLKEMNYHQTEGISYTDQEWISIPLFNVKRIKYLSVDLYKYYIGREGQTMDETIYNSSVDKNLFVAKKMIDTYNSLKDLYPKVNQKIVKLQVEIFIVFLYRNFLILHRNEETDKIFNVFDKEIKDSCKDIYYDLNNKKFGGVLGIKLIKMWRNNSQGIIFNVLCGLVQKKQQLSINARLFNRRIRSL